MFVFGSLGCSTVGKSTLLGVGSGAGLGAMSAAALASKNHQQVTLRGAGVGALVGGLTGYLFHKLVEKKETKVRRDTLFNLESHGISTGFDGVDLKKFNTFVTSPELREGYIETHTVDDGRKLIQGHKTWTIIGNPQFNLASPKRKRGSR